MRIAHVLRRLSFDDWGGTEQVVWNIAKAQKEAGHDVRLFATTALWKPELAGTGTCASSSSTMRNVSKSEFLSPGLGIFMKEGLKKYGFGGKVALIKTGAKGGQRPRPARHAVGVVP